MINLFKFVIPIGDWSFDGHGEVERFTIIGYGDIAKVREAHFKIKDSLGIEVSNLAKESCYLSSEEIEFLTSLGIDLDLILEDDDELCAKDLAFIWISLLNLVDDSLRLEFDNKLDEITFLGYDDKGRHIDGVGYGLFISEF